MCLFKIVLFHFVYCIVVLFVPIYINNFVNDLCIVFIEFYVNYVIVSLLSKYIKGIEKKYNEDGEYINYHQQYKLNDFINYIKNNKFLDNGKF